MKQQFRAEDDRERVIALASLPEAGLLATIETHAKEVRKGSPEALAWLESLVNGGFLEMSDCLAWDPTVPGGRGMNTAENEPFIDARAKRFDALMSFVKDTNAIEVVGFEEPQFARHDPIYGELERSATRARLTVDPGLVSVFAEACRRLVTDDAAFFAVSEPSQQSPAHYIREYRGLAHSHWASREDTFSKAIGMACALGLPDQVTALAGRCPEAITHAVELKAFLGDALAPKKNKPELCVTPYYCAVQFSQPECIDALVAAGMKGDCYLTTLRYADEATMKHTQHNIEAFLAIDAPMCAPSTLTKALRMNQVAGGQLDQNLHGNVVKALQGSDFVVLDAHLPAFLETQRLDLGNDPVGLVRTACEYGYPSLVKAMDEAGAIPWGEIGNQHTEPGSNEQKQAPDSDVIAQASSRIVIAGEWMQGKIEGALLALFDAAERAGTGPVAGLMAPYRSETHSPGDPESCPLFEPIDSILQAPFEKVMVRMMQNGLDPHAPYENISNRSPIQAAEVNHKDDIAHTMRTFVTHQRAARALKELDDMMEAPRP